MNSFANGDAVTSFNSFLRNARPTQQASRMGRAGEEEQCEQGPHRGVLAVRKTVPVVEGGHVNKQPDNRLATESSSTHWSIIGDGPLFRTQTLDTPEPASVRLGGNLNRR